MIILVFPLSCDLMKRSLSCDAARTVSGTMTDWNTTFTNTSCVLTALYIPLTLITPHSVCSSSSFLSVRDSFCVSCRFLLLFSHLYFLFFASCSRRPASLLPHKLVFPVKLITSFLSVWLYFSCLTPLFLPPSSSLPCCSSVPASTVSQHFSIFILFTVTPLQSSSSLVFCCIHLLPLSGC